MLDYLWLVVFIHPTIMTAKWIYKQVKITGVVLYQNYQHTKKRKIKEVKDQLQKAYEVPNNFIANNDVMGYAGISLRTPFITVDDVGDESHKYSFTVKKENQGVSIKIVDNETDKECAWVKLLSHGIYCSHDIFIGKQTKDIE